MGRKKDRKSRRKTTRRRSSKSLKRNSKKRRSSLKNVRILRRPHHKSQGGLSSSIRKDVDRKRKMLRRAEVELHRSIRQRRLDFPSLNEVSGRVRAALRGTSAQRIMEGIRAIRRFYPVGERAGLHGHAESPALTDRQTWHRPADRRWVRDMQDTLMLQDDGGEL